MVLMKRYLQYIKEMKVIECPPNRLKILDQMKFDKIEGNAVLDFRFHFIDKQNPKITYDICMNNDDDIKIDRFFIETVKIKGKYEPQEFYNEDANRIYWFIVENLVKNIDKITYFMYEVNRVEELFLDPKYKEAREFLLKKNMYIKMIELKDDVEKSFNYQKHLLDKGDISKLMKIKELQPYIKDKLKDAKKQSEWS